LAVSCAPSDSRGDWTAIELFRASTVFDTADES
jgi:hypothetical protein